MSIKAIVSSEETTTKKGTAKGSGKAYSITEQTVMMEFPSGERMRHALSLEDNELPLIKGTYTPKPTAFYKDGFSLVVSSRARDWIKA